MTTYHHVVDEEDSGFEAASTRRERLPHESPTPVNGRRCQMPGHRRQGHWRRDRFHHRRHRRLDLVHDPASEETTL